MSLPFQTIYDYFAKAMVAKGLGDRQVPPMIFFVETKHARITDVTPLDGAEVFMTSPRAKDVLSQFLNYMVPKLPPMAALVVISEAYIRTMTAGPNGDMPTREHASLEDDPLAHEVVMISVYSPEGTRIGHLPIRAGRKLEYAPVMDNAYTHAVGRLVVPPSVAPAGATKH